MHQTWQVATHEATGSGQPTYSIPTVLRPELSPPSRDLVHAPSLVGSDFRCVRQNWSWMRAESRLKSCDETENWQEETEVKPDNKPVAHRLRNETWNWTLKPVELITLKLKEAYRSNLKLKMKLLVLKLQDQNWILKLLVLKPENQNCNLKINTKYCSAETWESILQSERENWNLKC